MKARMTRAEKAYALELELEARAGSIHRWRFEGYRLRLAEKCFYTPDFSVVTNDDLLEFHEVKMWWINRRKGTRRAGWTEDSRVKIKTAAAIYPEHAFLAVIWDPETGDFSREVIS